MYSNYNLEDELVLHVLAQDTITDSQPVEEKFDHVYRMTQQEIEEINREAQAFQAEDAAKIRLIQLQEELRRLQQQSTENRLSNPAVAELVRALEVAVGDRNTNEAEKLLIAIKEML